MVIILCEVQLCALRVLALLNTVNHSMVVDQSDYSISTLVLYYIIMIIIMILVSHSSDHVLSAA